MLKLKQLPHPIFKRSRDNLSIKMTIPLRAALLGFETSCERVARPGQSFEEVSHPWSLVRLQLSIWTATR